MTARRAGAAPRCRRAGPGLDDGDDVQPVAHTMSIIHNAIVATITFSCKTWGDNQGGYHGYHGKRTTPWYQVCAASTLPCL